MDGEVFGCFGVTFVALVRVDDLGNESLRIYKMNGVFIKLQEFQWFKWLLQCTARNKVWF